MSIVFLPRNGGLKFKGAWHFFSLTYLWRHQGYILGNEVRHSVRRRDAHKMLKLKDQKVPDFQKIEFEIFARKNAFFKFHVPVAPPVDDVYAGF